LAIDSIDLYQVHWPSQSAPADETMKAIERLRQQGKIRHIGVSNYSSQQLSEALGFAPVISNQIKYNLLERDIEQDPLPLCQQRNIGVICYSPMAMGLLTGAVTMDRKFPDTDVRSEEPWFQLPNRRHVLDALESIRPIADAHSATFGQTCVAWILGNPGITTALVGARNARQVAENALAGDIHLSPQEHQTIRTTFEHLGTPGALSPA
jgi:aryl-alcohol dehydrogenase-like predicted oxidoreductase